MPDHPDERPRKGRPSKISEEVVLALAQLVQGGLSRARAARLLGIGERTLRDWMALGRDYPAGLYGTLRSMVREAELEFERQAVATIVAAGLTDDPWLMLEFLSRRLPAEYGKYRGELGEIKKRIRDLTRQLAADPEAGGGGGTGRPVPR